MGELKTGLATAGSTAANNIDFYFDKRGRKYKMDKNLFDMKLQL